MVLKALDLPDDTSLTAMEAMDGRLICLCGHPDFLKPLTFTSLVNLPLLHSALFLISLNVIDPSHYGRKQDV
jgi:hypothetical protein